MLCFSVTRLKENFSSPISPYFLSSALYPPLSTLNISWYIFFFNLDCFWWGFNEYFFINNCDSNSSSDTHYGINAFCFLFLGVWRIDIWSIITYPFSFVSFITLWYQFGQVLAGIMYYSCESVVVHLFVKMFLSTKSPLTNFLECLSLISIFPSSFSINSFFLY